MIKELQKKLCDLSRELETGMYYRLQLIVSDPVSSYGHFSEQHEITSDNYKTVNRFFLDHILELTANDFVKKGD